MTKEECKAGEKGKSAQAGGKTKKYPKKVKEDKKSATPVETPKDEPQK